MKLKSFTLALGVLVLAGAENLLAWDYEGHHAVNELALASLPSDFGIQLTPALKERIKFLAGEPDRWRNVDDVHNGRGLSLANVNPPDHYVDLEELDLYGLTPANLPIMRYDFIADIARARAAHPEKFPPIDPKKDLDHTRELTGLLPWTITEYYEKLKSDFATLKALRQYGGTPVEVANAEADCIYVMGVMGHFVGDGSQPLHTTKYFNGWFGPNPNGFTTRTTFHSWIDGGYFRKTGGIKVDQLVGKIQPATPLANADTGDGVFRDVVNYLVEQNKLVAPLYQMDKDGLLTGDDDKGLEGLPFLNGQLVKGGQMLGNLWLTAWLNAPEDTYLERQLKQRSATSSN